MLFDFSLKKPFIFGLLFSILLLLCLHVKKHAYKLNSFNWEFSGGGGVIFYLLRLRNPNRCIGIAFDRRNCHCVHFADQRTFVSFVFRHWQVGTERFVCLCTRAFTFVTVTERFDGEACRRCPMIDGRIRAGVGGRVWHVFNR